MARGDTQDNGSAAVAEAEQPAKPAKAKTSAMVQVGVPIELHKILVAKAEEEKKPLSDIARKLLADYVKYDKPIVMRTRTKKYATEAERKQAQAEKYTKAQALLAMLEAGEVDVETLARFEAAVQAKRDAEKAAKAANAEATPEPTPA